MSPEKNRHLQPQEELRDGTIYIRCLVLNRARAIATSHFKEEGHKPEEIQAQIVRNAILGPAQEETPKEDTIYRQSTSTTRAQT